MKTIFSLIIAVACSLYAQAQTNPRIPYNPYGEEELIFMGKVGGLYANKSMRVFKKSIIDENNYSMFTAPPGTDIVDARFKLAVYGASGYNGHIAVVLLDNGKIFQAKFAGGMGSYTQKELDPAHTITDVNKILGDDLYVMGYDGVLVSDSGYNWTIDTTGLGEPYAYNGIDIDTTQKVWLCTSNGLFTQDLNVTTWTHNTNYTGAGCDLVYVDRLQNIWVSYFNQLRVSYDGGQSFQSAPTGLYSGFIRDIADDAFGNIYVMWDNRLYYSQGGTQPFVRIDVPVTPDFSLFPTTSVFNDIFGDTLIYFSTASGLYTSDDQGTTWTYDQSVRAEHINTVAATADDRLLMTSNTGLFRMETYDNWTRRYPTTGFVPGSKVYAAGNGDLYLIAQRAGANSGGSYINMVYKSTDDGDSFVTDTNGTEAADVAMSIFFTDENGVQHAAATVNQGGYFLRVWKKTPGNPWALDTVGLPPVMNFNYSAVCFGTDNNGKVYVAISNNGLATIYSRPIAGGAWVSETTINGYVYDIKGRTGIVTIASSFGVTYKNGGSWQSIARPSGVDPSIDWCLTEVDNNGIVWAYYETFDNINNASIGEGIYFTDDLSTWSQAAGSPDTILFQELIAIGDLVFATTNGNDGVYLFDTVPGIITNIPQLKESALDLLVSPNPTKGTTTMQFTLEKQSIVALLIYNILGEKVYETPSQVMNAGMQQLEIRLPQQAKGTLIYNLSVNGVVTKGKIIRE